MTMITPSYLGETIEYSSLHACRSTLEDPTLQANLGCLRLAGDFIFNKHLTRCFNRVDIDVECVCSRRENAAVDLLVIDAYNHRCIHSCVLYR